MTTKKNRKGGVKSSQRAQRKAARLPDDPAFGMWADREDMKDVHAWLKKIRTPRYLRDGGSLLSPPRKKD